jgi:hypothetical protein
MWFPIARVPPQTPALKRQGLKNVADAGFLLRNDGGLSLFHNGTVFGSSIAAISEQQQPSGAKALMFWHH